MPEVVRQIGELRERLRGNRGNRPSIGFVPTMGALHAGHAALLEEARGNNDVVVVSIFVNPLQFDRKDDLDNYPRTMDADLALCDQYGADLIFAPPASEVYQREQLTFVDSPALSAHLCGAHRPGHFRGVATVVLKLFNIVQPDRAYFGQKDAQQLTIIRRMVEDLNLPVAIVPVPTVREADGLALSSRNKHLTAAQRRAAPVLSRALLAALDAIEKGKRSTAAIRECAMQCFTEVPAARPEYFEIADPETLEPVGVVAGPVLIAGAIWLGSTRLIDNVSWLAPDGKVSEGCTES